MNKSKYYYDMLRHYGSLPVEAQWDLIENLILLEHELVGFKVADVGTITTSSNLMPIKQLKDRLEIVQAVMTWPEDIPRPSDDYVKTQLMREMAPILSTLATYTSVDIYDLYRQSGVRAKLTVFKRT